MKRLTLILGLAAAACVPSGPEQFPISFLGAVTVSGVAEQGAFVELWAVDEGGLPELRGETTSDAAGRYAVSTTIGQSRCFLVSVEVEVRDAGGAVLHSGRRPAADCGQNLADFDF